MYESCSRRGSTKQQQQGQCQGSGEALPTKGHAHGTTRGRSGRARRWSRSGSRCCAGGRAWHLTRAPGTPCARTRSRRVRSRSCSSGPRSSRPQWGTQATAPGSAAGRETMASGGAEARRVAAARSSHVVIVTAKFGMAGFQEAAWQRRCGKGSPAERRVVVVVTLGRVPRAYGLELDVPVRVSGVLERLAYRRVPRVR